MTSGASCCCLSRCSRCHARLRFFSAGGGLGFGCWAAASLAAAGGPAAAAPLAAAAAAAAAVAVAVAAAVADDEAAATPAAAPSLCRLEDGMMVRGRLGPTPGLWFVGGGRFSFGVGFRCMNKQRGLGTSSLRRRRTRRKFFSPSLFFFPSFFLLPSSARPTTPHTPRTASQPPTEALTSSLSSHYDARIGPRQAAKKGRRWCCPSRRTLWSSRTTSRRRSMSSRTRSASTRRAPRRRSTSSGALV